MAYVIVIVVIVVLSALLWFTVLLPTSKIVDKLRALRIRAEEADDVPAVEEVWADLQVVYKECWHRSLGADAREVKAILDTKYRMLTQKPKVRGALELGSPIVEISTGRALKLTAIDIAPNGTYDPQLVAVLTGSDETGSIQATSDKFQIPLVEYEQSNDETTR